MAEREGTMENLVLGDTQRRDRDVNKLLAPHVVTQDLEYIASQLTHELKALAGNNLLITGGGGFLGYYLVQTIVHWNDRHNTSQSIHLTVTDNFLRGVPAWLENIEGHKDVEWTTHDVRDPLPNTLPHFQYIIHAASIASPTYYRLHPIETMDANVIGLRNLLEYTHSRKKQADAVKGMLFFSSSEIYGDPTPEHIPTPETYAGLVSCTGPRACYDESKRYGETLCVNFSRQFGLPVKIARPFNNYGPGLKITDRRVLPDFAHDVLRGKDIVLLSDGRPTRTFCYIADAVIGYYKVLVRGRNGEAYNIGVESPEVSMGMLAEKVADLAREMFGYSGRVVHQSSSEENYLVDNPQRRCPLITKAREELGYNPSIPLGDGLKRILSWYHGHPDGRIES